MLFFEPFKSSQKQILVNSGLQLFKISPASFTLRLFQSHSLRHHPYLHYGVRISVTVLWEIFGKTVMSYYIERTKGLWLEVPFSLDKTGNWHLATDCLGKSKTFSVCDTPTTCLGKRQPSAVQRYTLSWTLLTICSTTFCSHCFHNEIPHFPCFSFLSTAP